MSYASDLGLKVGSKIKVIGSGSGCCFNDGDIIELVEDDFQTNPFFIGGDSPNRKAFSLDRYKWEHYKEDTVTTKPQFHCCVATSEIKDEETFKKILDLFVANGAEVSDRFFPSKENWNWFGVDVNDLTTEYYNSVGSYAMDYEENDVTVYTLEQLLAFLPKEEAPVAQVPTLLPVGTEVKIAETSGYYGGEKDTSNPKDTKGTIIELDEDDDEFCYTVRWENGKSNGYGLNDLVLWEEEVVDSEGWIEWSGGECPVAKGTIIDVKFRGGDTAIGISANINEWEDGFYNLHSDTNIYKAVNWNIDDCNEDIMAYRLHVPTVASQEAITERLEDSPSVGIDYSVMGTTASTDPLITITQEVKYTVVIKGITFTFTQEEIDELAEELLGFTTL